MPDIRGFICVNRKTHPRGGLSESNIKCFDQTAIATFFRFLREPSRPNCVTIIIAAGWLGKSDNPGGKVAHVKTNSTTGSR